MTTKKQKTVPGTVASILAIFFIVLIYKIYFTQASPLSDVTSNNQNLIHVSYTCANDTRVDVTYDNTDRSSAKATFVSPTITTGVMTQILSGSGVRYSDGKYIWWSKGNTGFLLDATPQENMILNDCVSTSK